MQTDQDGVNLDDAVARPRDNDWDDVELRFSGAELCVVAEALGLGEFPGVALSLADDGRPESDRGGQLESALVARGVLLPMSDGEHGGHALVGPLGLILDSVATAPLIITAVVLGEGVAIRRCWYVSPDVSIAQRLADRQRRIFAFALRAPSDLLGEIVRLCGLPDTTIDSKARVQLDLDRVWEQLIADGDGDADVDTTANDRCWIVESDGHRSMSGRASSDASGNDREPVRVRLFESLAVDYIDAGAPRHGQVDWILDHDGTRWMTNEPVRGAGLTEIAAAGGRDILTAFVKMLPIDFDGPVPA